MDPSQVGEWAYECALASFLVLIAGADPDRSYVYVRRTRRLRLLADSLADASTRRLSSRATARRAGSRSSCPSRARSSGPFVCPDALPSVVLDEEEVERASPCRKSPIESSALPASDVCLSLPRPSSPHALSRRPLAARGGPLAVDGARPPCLAILRVVAYSASDRFRGDEVASRVGAPSTAMTGWKTRARGPFGCSWTFRSATS